MEAAVIVRTKNGYGTSHSHETYRAQGWSAGRNAARIDRSGRFRNSGCRRQPR